MDQSGENSSHGLDTERKWGNIQKENILDISSEDGSLDGSSNSNSLIWVDSLVWGFSEELLDTVLDLWHSSHTSNEDDLIDLILGES